MPQDLIMYPACPLPRHITTLYMIAVISSIALFSQSVTIVGADILVYCDDPYEQVEVEFRDMPSRFGDSLPLEGLEGYLVYADPPLGCDPVKAPPTEIFPAKSWILLISRGICTYESKIRNAQASNYSAVIVHNVNSSDLEPMSVANSTGIHIPSVFVGEHTGTFLRMKYQFNETQPCRHFILINDEMPFNFNTHLLLPFATVVGICCLIMLIFMVMKCLQDQRRQRRLRLPYSSLNQIPTSKFQKGDPYETCAICLEDYIEGEKLRLLPCSHAYHSKCIDQWLTRNRRVCPLCKLKVFARDERSSDDDSDSDDDTTPLVRPGAQFTQGGTFDRPSGNSLITSIESSGGASHSASSNSSYSSDEGPSTWTANGVHNPRDPCLTSKQLQAYYAQRVVQQSSQADSDPKSPGLCSDGTSSSTVSRLHENLAEGNNQCTLTCYNMSSGDHSINSQPIDLDFSDDHFEHGNLPSQWGSRVALLGSHSAAEGCALEETCEAETAEEALPTVYHATDVPSVSVRSQSTSSGSSSVERKPSVV